MKKSLTTLAICGSLVLLTLTACSNDSNNGRNVSGNTQYKSTSLDTASSSSQLAQAARLSTATVSGNHTFITPSNVSGEALHLSYVIADRDNEGVSVFNAAPNGGPESAAADIDLVDFDFSSPLDVQSSMYLQDGFIGGTISHIVGSFGSLDVDFYVDGSLKQVRIAMVTRNGMSRGDVLFNDSGTYKWLDVSNNVFTETRPTSPRMIGDIRDYEDTNNPQMLYYSLDIDLTNTATLIGSQVGDNSTIRSIIDFYVSDFVVIENETNHTSLTDVELINKLSIRPAVYIGSYNSSVTATVNITIQ